MVPWRMLPNSPIPSYRVARTGLKYVGGEWCPALWCMKELREQTAPSASESQKVSPRVGHMMSREGWVGICKEGGRNSRRKEQCVSRLWKGVMGQRVHRLGFRGCGQGCLALGCPAEGTKGIENSVICHGFFNSQTRHLLATLCSCRGKSAKKMTHFTLTCTKVLQGLAKGRTCRKCRWDPGGKGHLGAKVNINRFITSSPRCGLQNSSLHPHTWLPTKTLSSSSNM